MVWYLKKKYNSPFYARTFTGWERLLEKEMAATEWMKEIKHEQVKLLSDLLETRYLTTLWCLSSKKKAGTFWFFSRWSSKLNKVGVHPSCRTFLPFTGLSSELTLGSLSVVWAIGWSHHLLSNSCTVSPLSTQRYSVCLVTSNEHLEASLHSIMVPC